MSTLKVTLTRPNTNVKFADYSDAELAAYTTERANLSFASYTESESSDGLSRVRTLVGTAAQIDAIVALSTKYAAAIKREADRRAAAGIVVSSQRID